MAGDDHPVRRASAAPAVIAPGNYDGVHVGHRVLIARAREIAAARGLRVRPLTFDPHPAAVIAPERAPAALTQIPRRSELLRAAGADDVWVQPFTHSYSRHSPAEFVAGLIRGGAAALVVGPDFRFGQGRSGNVEQLRELCAPLDCQVYVEQPVLCEGERVSSSAIRAALADGDLVRATRLLGRVHEVEGAVVLGDQRGRLLGFPTANLGRTEVLVPADGVYAVQVRLLGPEAGDGLLQGVANVGLRPTFSAGRSIEVHLFDYAGDLYGQRLRVGFVARLRGEQRFGSAAELETQIGLDCERGKERLMQTSEDVLSWM